MASASGRRRGFSVVEALDREWCELVRDHRETAAHWADRHDVLASCRTLDDVLSVAKLNSDPVLAALLTEVSNGDQLAGRVVLQALIGRMVRMAQRDLRSSVDEYLASLWCVINNYPLQRRPVRIAANLSLDTLKAVSRERRWLGRGGVTLWPSSESLEELLSPAGLDGTPSRLATAGGPGSARGARGRQATEADRRCGQRAADLCLCRRHDGDPVCSSVSHQCRHDPCPVQQGGAAAGRPCG